MARGKENKEIVDRMIKRINDDVDFIVRAVSCIIPENEEHAKTLKEGLKALKSLRKFNDECNGDLGFLDELYDIDAVVENYPELEQSLNHIGDV